MRRRTLLSITTALGALALSSIALSQWQAAGTAVSIPVGASYDACGSSCVRNPGNFPLYDGFNNTINNFCPGGCNWTRIHAGSSCQGQNMGSASCCRAWTVDMPYYYTHTNTCFENLCDWSNSSFSESTNTLPTPTCAVQATCPGCVV